jgi:TPR repeat protein
MRIDWEKEPDIPELERATGVLSADPAEAVSILERLAARGSLMSMLHLGIIFERNEYGLRDPIKAEHWYRRTMDEGLPLAIYYLGLLYKRLGRYEEAFKVLQLGVSKGYGPTLTWLGLMYFDGQGVCKNTEKARELWEVGVLRGQVRSKKVLGHKFLAGVYGLTNVPKGLALIISAHLDVLFVGYKDVFSEKLL